MAALHSSINCPARVPELTALNVLLSSCLVGMFYCFTTGGRISHRSSPGSWNHSSRRGFQVWVCLSVMSGSAGSWNHSSRRGFPVWVCLSVMSSSAGSWNHSSRRGFPVCLSVMSGSAGCWVAAVTVRNLIY